MNIVFQGDSITDVGRTALANPTAFGQGYPLLVTAKLGAENPLQYEFFNRGISGNRIVDVYARIKVDCWNLNPDVLSLLIGVNDVWHEVSDRHNGVDTVRFEKVYRMLIEDTLERFPNIKLLLMEPFVLRAGATADNWDYFRTEVAARGEVVRRLAEEYHQFFVPLQARLDEACKLAPIEYWSADGVHPTPAGHQILANAWLEAFHRAVL